MEAIITNIECTELPNGMVAWTADLHVFNDIIQETVIHVENKGNGGQTKLTGDLQTINDLRAWAKKKLPDSLEPLEEIIDLTDENESLEDAVREMTLLADF
jgi:hypothetical protein